MDLWGNGILQCNGIAEAGSQFDVILEELSEAYIGIQNITGLVLIEYKNIIEKLFKKDECVLDLVVTNF